MIFDSVKQPVRSLAAGVAIGALMLGLSGAASAHGNGARHHEHSRHVERETVVVVRDGYHSPRRSHRYKHRGHRHGHRHHHRRYHKSRHRHYPREVVYVYEQPEPVREVVHVYEERPPVVVNRTVEYQPSRSSGHGTLNAGSLVGAAIGGLIGSKVGNGSGKLAATAAGTVGGFLLGGHTANHYR